MVSLTYCKTSGREVRVGMSGNRKKIWNTIGTTEVIRILAHCRKKIGTAEVVFTGVTDIQRVNEGAVVRETSLTGATRVTGLSVTEKQG